MGRGWARYKREHLFFLLWFAVTFTVFEIARSKLASYILPLFPAMVVPLAMSVSHVRLRSRSKTVLSLLHFLSGLALVVLPSLVTREYRDIATTGAVNGIRFFGGVLIAGSVLLWRGRIKEAIMTKACGVVVLVVLLGSGMTAALDWSVADAFVGDIVAAEHYGTQWIVTDTGYARGVYFYTGNPVVVMDHNTQPFWSPHPIEIISGQAEVERFFGSRDRVLCVLDDARAQELDRMFEGRRASRQIAKSGHKVVVMSEKMPGPRLGEARHGEPRQHRAQGNPEEAIGSSETSKASTQTQAPFEAAPEEPVTSMTKVCVPGLKPSAENSTAWNCSGEL